MRRTDRPDGSRDSLSTSSSISTGLRRPALRTACTMLPGQRADVGAPMAADLRLIMHAAQLTRRNCSPSALAMLWPSEVLPTPGGPDEAQDGAAALRVELAHGQELENAALDLLEAVVILVQDRARPLDVELLRVDLRPGHGDEPVQIGARHGIFGRAFGHALQARELAQRLLLRFGRHSGLGDRLLEFLESPPACDPPVSPSSFWIWCRRSRSTASFCRSSKASRVRSSIWRETLSTSIAPVEEASTRSRRALRSNVARISCFSAAFRSMKLATMSASVETDSMARIALPSSAGRLRQQLQGFHRPFAQGQAARFDLAVGHRRLPVRLDARHEERFLADVIQHGEALLALADQMMVPSGGGDEAHDGGDGADADAAAPGRAHRAASACSTSPTRALSAHGFLGGGQRALAAESRSAARRRGTARCRATGRMINTSSGSTLPGDVTLGRAHRRDPVRRKYR